MAIADSKALLAEIMNAVDNHVTAKASRQLEQQIMDVLEGYQVATMIRDDYGDADNSLQLVDAFIGAKTAEGLAKSSIYLYRFGLPEIRHTTKDCGKRGVSHSLNISKQERPSSRQARRRNEHECIGSLRRKPRSVQGVSCAWA